MDDKVDIFIITNNLIKKKWDYSRLATAMIKEEMAWV